MTDKVTAERDRAAAKGESTLVLEDLDIIYSSLGENSLNNYLIEE